ncbi:MAG: PEP-CTERM sorting domain-containing protein [Pirellulales bacterium]
MKRFLTSCARLPHAVFAVAIFAVVAGIATGANNATAGIISNTNPNFQQVGGFFGTYSVLPNADPNGGGFFLRQNEAVPEYYDPFFQGTVPSQPASSFLSSFSASHFSFAAFDQVVDSSLVLPSNTGIGLVNGTYYIAFDVEDAVNSNAVYYGWMNVTAAGVDTMDPIEFTLNAWAYDDTGASIKVGQISAVPEPSTCALALAGLACGGYSLFRRRRPR